MGSKLTPFEVALVKLVAETDAVIENGLDFLHYLMTERCIIMEPEVDMACEVEGSLLNLGEMVRQYISQTAPNLERLMKEGKVIQQRKDYNSIVGEPLEFSDGVSKFKKEFKVELTPKNDPEKPAEMIPEMKLEFDEDFVGEYSLGEILHTFGVKEDENE